MRYVSGQAIDHLLPKGSATVADALESLPAAWFDREVLHRRFAEHQAGRRDPSHLLWSLLVLEHWRRRHDVLEVAA